MEQNTAETIARTLGKEILDGSIAAGAQLPPVRELAQTWQVNTATIQRVVAQLEAQGLVEARRGSGVRVLDTDGRNRLQMWPLLLETLQNDPDELAALVADALEVRRSLSGLVLSKLPSIPKESARKLVASCHSFMDACRKPSPNTAALLAQEYQLFRDLLQAVNQRAILAFLNELELCINALPELIDAFYGQPEWNARIWQYLAQLIESPPVDLPNHLAMIQEFLAQSDAEITTRIRAHAGGNKE